MLMPWVLFVMFVLLLLALDLGVFHRSAHVVSFREAVGWSAVWLTLGLVFAGVVFFAYEYGWFGLGTYVDPVDGMINTGSTAVEKYLTGYVVEKSLSIDNIFVIAMIFGSLAVPAIHQHRVLFWGVVGALAMRAAMIVIGAKLIAEFHWILSVFAVILLVTALKMLTSRSDHADPSKSLAMKLCRTWLPIANGYHGQRFLVRSDARSQPAAGGRGIFTGWMLTPLAVALIMVESADLVFAIDSIPAIFAITGDPFLVFTSNVFAMLGLRSLYFALAGMMTWFHYLKVSLAAVLMVVGGKMLAAEWLKQVAGPDVNLYLLGVIIVILAAGMVGSILSKRRRPIDDGPGLLGAQPQ